MAHPVLLRTVVAAATALTGLAFSVTAQAETVSYDFTANVTSVSSPELGATLSVGSQLTGSFSYDDAAPAIGGLADPTLQIDQIEVINGANGGVILWGSNFIARAESDYPGSYMVGLFLPNVRLDQDGSLPSSLNATGARLEVRYGFLPALSANVSSMTTGSSVPELDPVSGAGAGALLAGGIAMMYGRRRQQVLSA